MSLMIPIADYDLVREFDFSSLVSGLLNELKEKGVRLWLPYLFSISGQKRFSQVFLQSRTDSLLLGL